MKQHQESFICLIEWELCLTVLQKDYLDFRRFGGTQHHRTAFAGATTGQQLLYALDEQVRSYEVAGLVTKYEGWEFLGTVIG